MIMNIAYSCNDNYIPQTGISMISVFENNKDVEDIIVYLISKDVSEDNIRKLQQISDSYNRKFVEVKFDDIAYDLNISNIGRHIETIYSKVFFSRIKDLSKIIYLDSDTVVVGSLKDLWDIPLDDCYMGVVQSLSTESMPTLGMSSDVPFFNDGMAIVNVDYCRANDLIGKTLKVIDDYNGNPPVLSEGALNKVCQGKVKYISPRYNMMAGLMYLCNLDIDYVSKKMLYTKEELTSSIESPVVIHYLSAFYNRPWFKKCSNPYRHFYYKYKSVSPWADIPLQEGGLSKKLRLIDMLYRTFGLKKIDYIRKILNSR